MKIGNKAKFALLPMRNRVEEFHLASEYHCRTERHRMSDEYTSCKQYWNN